MAHLGTNKDQLLSRVRRIAGQMRAIEKAIDGEAECATVLHQVAGVRGAVAGLMEELIADHLQEHVARADLSAEARATGAAELLAAIRRYAR